MRKFLFILIAYCCSFFYGMGQNTDSLAKVAINYAALNNIAELRPLFKNIGEQLPQHIQLFCKMAISRNDGEYKQMIECIDSLLQWHPKQIKTKTLLSLSELKAEGLRQMGKYDELYGFCEKQINVLRKKRLKKDFLKEMELYKEKAKKIKGSSPKAILLQHTDRDLIFELDSLFYIYKEEVDECTQLRCRLSLAQAFHKSDDLLETSQLLLEKYSKELDVQEFSKCIQLHAEELIHRGEWNRLKKWCELVGENGRNHNVPIQLYLKLANTFIDKPRYRVVRPLGECSVRTSYEWPILFKAKVNQKDEINFTVNTAQPYTFITEDIARKCKVEILSDTVLLSSTHGIIEASPGWIETLSLGNITFNNVYVYVQHVKEENSSLSICSMGLQELMALKQIKLLPEKMIISSSECDTKHQKQSSHSIFISKNKNLCLAANSPKSKSIFNLDIKYPNNVLFKEEPSNIQEKDIQSIQVGNTIYNIYRPLFVDSHLGNNDGVLGVPFIRNYHTVVLDFEKMEFYAQKEIGYHPARGNFGHYTDKNYLLRNREALEAGSYGSNDLMFLQELIAIGKNQPQKVVDLSKMMRLENNEFYDVSIECEYLCLCGKYNEALYLIDYFTQQPTSTPSENDDEQLKELQKKIQLYKNVPPMDCSGIEIKRSNSEEFVVRIRNKKIEANFSIFKAMTEISAKSAKKYKVKKVGIYQKTTYGMIPQIDCNGIVLKNIPCIINNDKKQCSEKLPNNGKGICLGWNVLRHFQKVTYTADSTLISLDTINQENLNDRHSISPVYIEDGHWFIETETEGMYPTYRLTPLPYNVGPSTTINVGKISIPAEDFKMTTVDNEDESEGDISLPYLISKTGKVTIDIANMQIIL